MPAALNREQFIGNTRLVEHLMKPNGVAVRDNVIGIPMNGNDGWIVFANIAEGRNATRDLQLVR